MSVTNAVAELVLAFVSCARRDGHLPNVSFSWGRSPDGLIRIFGPHATAAEPGTVAIAIDQRSGDVLFADERLARALGASERRLPSTDIPSEHNAFPWVLSRQDIVARFASTDHFVDALTRACDEEHARW